jgi:hypothetical protein
MTVRRAEARDKEARGMARIAAASRHRRAPAGAEYKDDEDVDAIRGAAIGCCIINVAPASTLEFLPPAPDRAADSARADAVSLAVPGGGRAFLWSKRPRADRVEQGRIGSCWFLAAVATAAERQGTIEKCFPAAGRRAELPAGACPVALYDIDGDRRTLPLDTRLYYRPSGSPAYARSRGDGPRRFESEELWVPMLEKAMARMRGRGYKGVHGGQASQGLFALTGASVEVVTLAENDGSIFTELARGHAAGDIAVASVHFSPLMTLLSAAVEPLRCIAASICGLPVYSLTDLVSCLFPLLPRRAFDRFCKANCSRLRRAFNALIGVVLGLLNVAAALILAPILLLTCGNCLLLAPLNGIYPQHAYTVLADNRVFLRCCGVACGSERVVRLRNPHGKGSFEWRGKWSDNSMYWLCVSDADRLRVGYQWSDENYCARACKVPMRLCPYMPLCCPLLYYNEEAVGHASRDDGAFFMSEADFFSVFHRVDICHHRPSWDRKAVKATLHGKCAYFTIRVDAEASTLPTFRLPTDAHIGRHHRRGRIQRQRRVVVPFAERVTAASYASASSTSIAGVYASVAIADPDGTRRVTGGGSADGVRISIFDKATRRPVASTQPDNSRDSFTGANPVAGTTVAALLAGHSYTVFVQWGGGWARPGPTVPREVSLVVSASAMSFLRVHVSQNAPHPLLPWAPVGPTAYGVCAKGECGLALPSDFAYVFGERFHRECVPEVTVCRMRAL